MRNLFIPDLLLKIALAEDIGKGDITTAAIRLGNKKGEAIVFSKADGIVSGIEQFKRVFEVLSRNSKFKSHKKNGSTVHKGEKVISVQAPLETLLKGERTAMNFLCHLSGVATSANRFVKAVKGTKALILDTRKTMPGMRELEKKAVADGGGCNHRHGLFDMYLIKENHIAAAGGIEQAMAKAKQHWRRTHAKIEIEVRNLPELKEALRFDPDVILLDNFSIGGLKKAVSITRRSTNKVLLEASGNVNSSNVESIAATGVDRISIGQITHSAPALDLSFQIINWKN